ncbi:MAG TPA: hypothetical protein VMF06_21645 [Candidatus Limnocylindria bacterium]|nr:hypothetical protein [Candidatus Limnocylindria bacterium]
MLLVAGGLAGCAIFRFEPGFSMTDPEYFSEPPRIVAKPEGYSIRWRYDRMGFFFQPESKVVEGQLLFALQATSSSGSLSGRYGESPISGPKRLYALESGGAFWLEPDGRKIRLEVTR